MKQVVVIGKTEAIINLNKIGVPVRGKSTAILNINNYDQEAELMGCVRAGLLEIIQDTPPVISSLPSLPTVTDNAETTEKKKGGRPKGSKNKSKDIIKDSFSQEEQMRISAAEAKTQKMGSRVVIGTPDGAKQGRMKYSAIDDIVESEQTRASIEAMEKLEKEEKEEISLPDTLIDESKLDASEQMGRKAIIATEGGLDEVNMVNSILPEAKVIKDADPFIDKVEKQAIKETEDRQAAKRVKDDGIDDAFIEI